MSDLNQTFEEAATNVKKLTVSPTKEELLDLYGLYKQATVGNNNTAKPSFYDLKGKAKWNAWTDRKDVEQNDAKQQYVDLVTQVLEKYQ